MVYTGHIPMILSVPIRPDRVGWDGEKKVDMEVRDIKISKEQLQALPDAERVVVLQFGHVCNELSFLNKLLLIVSNGDAEDIEQRVLSAQSMIVTRLYIGKVFEGWRVVEEAYFKSQLSKSMDPILTNMGKESLDRLKRYFGRNNLMASIRNNFSFHYLSEHIPETMDAIGDKTELHFIASALSMNSLYSYSEDIATLGMLQLTEENDVRAAMNKVIGDLACVGGDMIIFLGDTVATVFFNRFGTYLNDYDYTSHDIRPSHSLEDFKLPFFFHQNDDKA
jgi:hypothetical protein